MIHCFSRSIFLRGEPVKFVLRKILKGEKTMKKYSLLFSIFLLPVILSLSSCFNDNSDTGPSAGTVTVTLTGASAHNGKTFYFSLFSQSDLFNSQGFGSFIINASGGSGVIQSGGSDLSLSGGTYYLTCFIDEDGNADPGDPAVETGDDYYFNYATVNGNTTVDLTYPDDFTIE